MVEWVPGPAAEREGELLVDVAVPALEEAVEWVADPATEREGELLVDTEALGGVVTGPATEREGELLVDPAVDEAEASVCAFLTFLLAAALVCQLHEHSLLVEGLKKDPC